MKRIVSILLCMVFFVSVFTVNASAAGLNIETEDNGYEYTEYADAQYSLDYHNAGWGWFDMGANLSEAVNGLANGLWGFSRTLSVFTGGIIEQAYSLDFIRDFSYTIGENIQTLAGISPDGGISGNGLFYGFLLLFILVLGIYVLYTGLLKKQASRAISAVMNFILVFVLTVAFVLSAPFLMGGLASFSSEVNNGVLNAGARLVYPDSEIEDTDSTKVMINNLWNIQIKQPWLILQFGTTGVEEERTEKFLALEPNSKERKEVAKKEVEEFSNHNMASENVWSRLGNVLLIIIVNLIISIFVIALMAIMLLSQLFFMIYAMVLPFSMILSLLPNMGSKMMKSLINLFNILLARTGISLITTIAFCLSSVFYSLTSSSAFLFVSFLQILNFACVFFLMERLLSLVSIDLMDYRHVQQRFTRMGRKVTRTIGIGSAIGYLRRDRKKSQKPTARGSASGSGTSGGSGSSTSSGSGGVGGSRSSTSSGSGGTGGGFYSRTGSGSSGTGGGFYSHTGYGSGSAGGSSGRERKSTGAAMALPEPKGRNLPQLPEHSAGGSSGRERKSTGAAMALPEPKGRNLPQLPEHSVGGSSARERNSAGGVMALPEPKSRNLSQLPEHSMGGGFHSRKSSDNNNADSSPHSRTSVDPETDSFGNDRQSTGQAAAAAKDEKVTAPRANSSQGSKPGQDTENKPRPQKISSPASVQEYIKTKEQPPVTQERERPIKKPPEKAVPQGAVGKGGPSSMPQLSRKQKPDVTVIQKGKQPTERSKPTEPPKSHDKPGKGGRR